MFRNIKKLLLILNSLDPNNITYSLVIYMSYDKDTYNMNSKYKVTKWSNKRVKNKETRKYEHKSFILDTLSGYSKDILDYLLKELDIRSND